MKYLIILVSLMLIFCCGVVSAEPTATEVYTDMLTMWDNYEFSQLEAYINTLYQNYPNYIPAILAKSFHNYIYEGELILAKDKLLSVKQYLEGALTPELEMFFAELLHEIRELEEEIEMHEEHGTAPEQLKLAASPQAIRNSWANTPPPILIIIYDSPGQSIVP